MVHGSGFVVGFGWRSFHRDDLLRVGSQARQKASRVTAAGIGLGAALPSGPRLPELRSEETWQEAVHQGRPPFSCRVPHPALPLLASSRWICSSPSSAASWGARCHLFLAFPLTKPGFLGSACRGRSRGVCGRALPAGGRRGRASEALWRECRSRSGPARWRGSPAHRSSRVPYPS